jgi:hypothetical protein
MGRRLDIFEVRAEDARDPRLETRDSRFEESSARARE